MPQLSSHSQPDYGKKWYVMAAVAMSIFLATLDGSIVNIALPTMQKALHTEFAMIQWVVIAYLLVVTTLLLGMGRLGDMYGKKQLYLTGFIIFTLGSFLCGTANSVHLLIGYRAFQGIGAAMMMALGAAIITEAFPASERGQALGIIGTMVSIGIVAGPVLGGIIIGQYSWHWIFYVNIPLGIVGIWMVARFVPHIKPAGGQKFDYIGGTLLFFSLSILLIALTLGQKIGFDDLHILGMLSIWIVLFVLFFIVEFKVSQPMLDLSIFLNSLLSINVITGFVTFITISGVFLLMPYYLENVLHYDTQTTGMLLSVVPLAMGIIAPIAGRLSDIFGTRMLTVAGLGILMAGYLAISTLGEHTTTMGYILRFIPIGIGMGIFQSPNNSAIMGSVTKTKLGVASGLLSITRTLGQTVGISVMGALWASFVLLHAGHQFDATPTNAPLDVQVGALQHTFLIAAGFLGLTLLLGIWGLKQSSKHTK